jgi:hypothetical protein
LKDSEPALTQELLVRVLKRHQWHDKHQVNVIPLRSFSIIKKRKMHIKILQDCVELVKKFHGEDQRIPVCERLKNLKAFHINDFYRAVTPSVD